MPEKKGLPSVYAAVIPTILLIPVTVTVLLLRSFVFKETGGYTAVLWVNAVLIALNPGLLLCFIPLTRKLAGMKGAYTVSEVVTAEGVKPETLNRCASIAEAQASHPIGECLRAYCGDVGAPPDKFAETPGYGVSAQFSGQMIHVGSEEYLKRLGVEVPHTEGTAAHVALGERALGYYRFLHQAEIKRMRTMAFRGMLLAGAFKVLILALFAFGGTKFLAYAAAGEALSFAAALYFLGKATK